MSRKPRGHRPRSINPNTARLTGALAPAIADIARRIYKQIAEDEYETTNLSDHDRANIRQRVTDRMNSSGYRVTREQVDTATACLRCHDPEQKGRPVKLPWHLNVVLNELAMATGKSRKDLATELIPRGLAASNPAHLGQA